MATTTTTTTATKGTRENPFILRQGNLFSLTIRVKKADGSAFDLTGFAGRSQMRKLPADPDPPVAVFTVSITSPTQGLATLTLGATLSAFPLIAAGLYVFDVEFENTTDPDDVVHGGSGFINVIQEVTR